MRAITEAQASYESLVSAIDEDLGVQTVHAALESGCTLVIDTAALYGGGKARGCPWTRIGRTLIPSEEFTL